MKHPLKWIWMLVFVIGCATPPVYMVDNFHAKKIVRCDNAAFCFHEKYSVVWDHSCGSYYYSCCSGCKTKGYPVSYRSLESICENDPYGYAVTLPQGGNLAMP
jgi:hypothetical protein